MKVIPMFTFKGLPETVNERYLKASLILTGNCAIWKPKNKSDWYAVKGTMGAEPDAYYIGTEYVIANPVLGSENIKTDDPRIQVFYWSSNDEIFQPLTNGLFKLIERTARTLTELYRSTLIAIRHSRVVNIFSASTKNEQDSLNTLLQDMIDGKDVFTSIQNFKSLIQVNPVLADAPIKDILQEFIETEQFHLAQFYHAIGVNSNYNLKRAQVNNEEIMTNAYILVVSLADVLPTLQRCCEEFNAKTGLSISVDFSEDWKKMREMEMQAPESDIPNESPNSDSEEPEENSEETEDTKETEQEETEEKEDKKEGDDDEQTKKDKE